MPTTSPNGTHLSLEFFRYEGNDLFGIPKHNQENAQMYTHNYANHCGVGEGIMNPTLSWSLPGKGCAFGIARPPSTTCTIRGSAGADLAARSQGALGTEVPRNTARLHAGPRGHRSLERQRQRSRYPLTASRAASSGFPFKAGTAPGHPPSALAEEVAGGQARTPAFTAWTPSTADEDPDGAPLRTLARASCVLASSRDTT